MKENPKVLIVVTTEFGLLKGLIYYLMELDGKYEPFFVILSDLKHFKELDLRYLPGKYYVFIDKLNDTRLEPDKSFEKILHVKNVREIVFQNSLNFISNIVINYYKKIDKNILLTMVSDGLVLHNNVDKKRIFYLYIKLYFRIIYNKIKYLNLLLHQNSDMAKSVDLLIADQNIGAKNFIDSEYLLEKTSDYPIISKIFKLDKSTYEKTDIIFFTQPLYAQSAIPKNVQKNYFILLSEIMKYATKKKYRVIIKIHPSENIEKYKSFSNEYILIDENKSTPAEILLGMIKNKKIVSMFSSVSLNNSNSTLSHFWLYKIVGYKMASERKFEHINVPSNLEEFILDLEKIERKKQ